MRHISLLLFLLVLLVTVSICSVSHAATMDDYVTCSLVYAGLAQAAKDAHHDGMLEYSKPRLEAVLPFIQQNRDNPKAKEILRETATRLEDEVKNRFVKQATDALLEEDPEKLGVAMMPRVFECDRAFGLSTLPLPLVAKQFPPSWNKYIQGFHAGCIAKQADSPFSSAQIQKYCRCMTEHAVRWGIDSISSKETVGRMITENHGACFSSIQ